MTKQKGFVLLIVLVLLQIITLVGLYSMLNTALLLKMHRQYFQQMQANEYARQALSLLEQHVMSINKRCVFPAAAIVDIATADDHWRSQYACSDNINGMRYDYIVETLDIDPCAIVDADQDKEASYYRITLWAFFPMSPVATILQSSVVVPVANQGVCVSNKHPVSAGRQMIREWDL